MVIGMAIPILSKYVPFLKQNPFIFVIGKTVATGVLLSVSCIHLIMDAVRAFEEPCVNAAFMEFYRNWAFAFALVAVLLIHAGDIQLAVVTEQWMVAKQEGARPFSSAEASRAVQQCADAAAAPPGALGNACSSPSTLYPPTEGESPAGPPVPSDTWGEQSRFSITCSSVRCPNPLTGRAECVRPAANSGGECVGWMRESTGLSNEQLSCNTPGCSWPTHRTSTRNRSKGPYCSAILMPPKDMPHTRRMVTAICMVASMTLHSFCTGISIGLTADPAMRPMLIACVIHQVLEGLSLGSRIVDAKFSSTIEVVFAAVFSASTPLGMTVAAVAVSAKKDAMSGGGFVLMMAVLNSFCGGMLLHLAFSLLFTDFPDELDAYATAEHPRRRAAMFIALWAGMLSIIILDKWM